MTAKRILLVEHELLARERLLQLLSKYGHSVVQANNGAEGFALFMRGQFDLVITDYEVPFVKGDELATQIKKLSPWQPILMISAIWKRPGPDNPVDAALHQACDTRRLLQVLTELLSRSEDRIIPAASDSAQFCPGYLDRPGRVNREGVTLEPVQEIFEDKEVVCTED